MEAYFEDFDELAGAVQERGIRAFDKTGLGRVHQQEVLNWLASRDVQPAAPAPRRHTANPQRIKQCIAYLTRFGYTVSPPKEPGRAD